MPGGGVRGPGDRVLASPAAGASRSSAPTRTRLLHGYETGIIMRSPEGAYAEKHLPISGDEAYTLTARDRDEVARRADRGRRARCRANRKVAMMRLRATAVAGSGSADNIQKPTREELEEATHHAEHELSRARRRPPAPRRAGDYAGATSSTATPADAPTSSTAGTASRATSPSVRPTWTTARPSLPRDHEQAARAPQRTSRVRPGRPGCLSSGRRPGGWERGQLSAEPAFQSAKRVVPVAVAVGRASSAGRCRCTRRRRRAC